MAERRKQGLRFNCDEQYVRGHRCQCLFYIKVEDYDADGMMDDHSDEPEIHQ